MRRHLHPKNDLLRISPRKSEDAVALVLRMDSLIPRHQLEDPTQELPIQDAQKPNKHEETRANILPSA